MLRRGLQRALLSSPPTRWSRQRCVMTSTRSEAPSDRSDPLIVQYYVEQGIFQSDAVPEIVATLERPLPACFRVSPASVAASKIISQLTTEFPALFDGQPVAAPRELTWFPTRHGAWQLDCGKTALAKLARDHEPLSVFRDFLLHHTAEGSITRQEAASMLPPLLLDVQPHHRALDLCAAPGSKTSQVMEALLARGDADSGHDRGFVVANDASEQRGYMLVHQLQRLGLTNAAVTCHAGQDFPGLYDASTGRLQVVDVFDRVLCDVPCTGDGTIRKNRDLWRRWSPGGALTLHSTQLELALRGAALLKPGGLLSYSTCSLNPVENEAVVAELLRRAGGALELVDCSDRLPGLITRPGVSSWRVAWQPKRSKRVADSLALEWFDEYDAVPSRLRGSRVLRSMFPPEAPGDRDLLRRCVRLFPTDQDTGGFFVALLRKSETAALPGGSRQLGLEAFETIAARSTPVRDAYECALCGENTHTIRRCPQSRSEQRRAIEVEAAAAEMAARRLEQENNRGHGYARLRDDHWHEICEFYGIGGDRFPREHLFGRSDGAASVCLVSEAIQGSCLAGRDLKILDTGVRVFARVPAGERLVFRPTEEGLPFVLPFITKRKLPGDARDLAQLLTKPLSSNDSAPDQQAHDLDVFSTEFVAAAAAARTESGVGPILMTGRSTEGQLALPAWLGTRSIALLVDDETRRRLLVQHQLEMATAEA